MEARRAEQAARRGRRQVSVDVRRQLRTRTRLVRGQARLTRVIRLAPQIEDSRIRQARDSMVARPLLLSDIRHSPDRVPAARLAEAGWAARDLAMRDLAAEAISAAALAARDSAIAVLADSATVDLATADLASDVDSDAGAAASAASDGASDLAESDSAGAASGIHSGGDRDGASDGVRRIHTMRRTRMRIGLRMARPILTTIGAARTARPRPTTRRPATHLTTTTRLMARTSVAGIRTATGERRFRKGLRNQIRWERISRCLGPQFSFT